MENNTSNLPNRPMRLLSIDGGGLAGLIPAEALTEIETQLDALTGQSQPLCDRFDLIGGTSTGAILAVGLALGLKAAELRDFYLKFGKQIFTKVFWLERFWHNYPSGPLERHLKDVFGKDTTLGSEKLRTSILIVSKNVTLGTTWFFTNNPQSKYFANNQALPLWQIVRASSAAPTYFPPQRSPSRTIMAGLRSTTSSTGASAATTIPRCRFSSKRPIRTTTSGFQWAQTSFY